MIVAGLENLPRLRPDEGIVVLTGAGISAESGVPTFRDAGGLWQQHSVMELATPEGFRRNPDLVHRFYNDRRARLGDVHPNPAHHALARLAAAWPGPFLLVTQNVDDLHDRAAAAAGADASCLVHMHGRLDRVRCLGCAHEADAQGALATTTVCARCGQAGGMRPAIVWFGEMPLYGAEIEAALAACRLFVAVGTSGQVWPAAGYVSEARGAGAFTVELNVEPSEVADRFHTHAYGRATATMPILVERLLAGLPASA